MSESIFRFGVFELDAQTGELRKHGIRIKLAEQPFRVLITLLERPGELAARDHLRQRIWPKETAGDFEQGLNRAVSKLREALGDSASNPRFVETLPGRGYRFIGMLQRPEPAVQEVAGPRRLSRRTLVIAACALGLLGLAGFTGKLLLAPGVPRLRWRRLTTDNYPKVAPALSDGMRLYFAASFAGEQFIAQAPVSGGQPTKVPITPPGPVFMLHDLSPDGQELLLTAAASNNRLRMMPLWTLQIADGTAKRLGAIAATSAAYSPSGNAIAYATSTGLWIASKDGSKPRHLVELADSLLASVYWSPDQARIRFSRRDPISNRAAPWEIGTDGLGLREVLPESGEGSLIPAGWASRGELALFAGSGTFWGTLESWDPFRKRGRIPERLVDDAPEFDAGVRVRNGDTAYAIGTDRLAELQRYDRSSDTWVPLYDGISAEALEYSPDRHRVAYVTYPQRTLWVRQADGSRPIQLTSPPLVATFPRWSRDGRRIAFVGNESDDKSARLYAVDAEGGPVKPVLEAATGSQGYPTWSPDGKELLYGTINSSTREEVYIRVANLESGKVTKLPGSEGLFAPRWSPDGMVLAALQWSDQRHLMLYRVKDKKWEEVKGRRVDWPSWDADSKSIFGRSGDSLIRYRLESGTFEVLTDIKPDEIGGFLHWIGLGLDGTPIRALNRDSRQVYALQVEPR